MKTLKKTAIMIVLTLLCIIIIDNYQRIRDEKRLENGEKDTNVAKEEQAEEPSYELTFLALGQTYMNDSVINSGRQEDGTLNYQYLFQGVGEQIQAADISVLCQGSVIGGNSLGVSGYPNFNSPEELCDAVAAAGIDAVAMANVRVNNMGSAAINTSLDIWKLRAPEVNVLGIHGSPEESDYVLVEQNGLKIALFDYTAIVTTAISNEEAYKIDFFGDYADGSANLDTLSEQTKAQLAQANEVSDFIIVFASWGLEDTHEITATQERFAKQLTEAGADLIIGNRPNYLQKVEWVTADNGNRALCYYSLGNFVSSDSSVDAMLGGMAKVSIKVQDGQTVIDESNTGLIPVVTHYTSDGTGNEVKVEGVIPFESYTDEQAALHGVRNKTSETFNREALQNILNANVDTKFVLH